jgi:uncharacterized membrane protein
MAIRIRSTKALLFSMVAFAACLGAAGQLLFKLGVTGHVSLLYLIPGVAAYGAATAIYLTVLSKSHLSWAYGLNGISYVVTVFLALTFLHETIPPMRWVGVAIIAIGAALVGFS